MKEHLAVALTTTNFAPGVKVTDRYLLTATRGEGVVEIVLPGIGLVPGVLRIAKEHAQKVSCARLVCLAIGCTGVHDTQIVDELNVALLAIKLGADLLGYVLHGVNSMHLLL